MRLTKFLLGVNSAKTRFVARWGKIGCPASTVMCGSLGLVKEELSTFLGRVMPTEQNDLVICRKLCMTQSRLLGWLFCYPSDFALH